MCGIAGFCLNKDEHIDARALTIALLNQIVERGTDATGMAWYDKKENKIRYSRQAVPAPMFCINRVPVMDKDTKTAILHTRWATKGTIKNNDNNHPIIVDKIVGVHNGHINNDDSLFRTEKMKRKAQVDSEVIFALLNKYSKKSPTETFTKLQGRAAVAWLDRRDPSKLQVARVQGSPLAVAQTEKGSFIFASTKQLLETACESVNLELEWVVEMEEYEMMEVKDGKVNEYVDFKPKGYKHFDFEQYRLA